MDQQDYVTLQLINTCLRENIADLMTKGCIEIHTGQYWLCANHLARPLRLQVSPYDYMQHWLACFPYWQEKYQYWQTCMGHHAWLALLMTKEDKKTDPGYLAQLKAACYQREHCQQAYHRYGNTQPVSGAEKVCYAERLASYHSDPYLFNGEEEYLPDERHNHYAPEGGHSFTLEWLAIPRQSLTLSGTALPLWWPCPTQIGLNDPQTTSYSLLPVHPLTMAQLDGLPPKGIRAKEGYLTVYASRSITTLQLVDYPRQQLQLPLLPSPLLQPIMLMTPETLRLAHQCVAEILSLLEQQDPLLHGRLFHMDEYCYGYLNEAPALSFLLQCYPTEQQEETLASVAALGETMPDGHSYLHHLLIQQGISTMDIWWETYCQIMAEVHLTLWLQYGIVLSCKPQNILLSFNAKCVFHLVMRESNGISVLIKRLIASCPSLKQAKFIGQEINIYAESDNVLAQKFITLVLQRSLAGILEDLADKRELIRNWGYKILRDTLKSTLEMLRIRGVDIRFAQKVLFEAKYQPIMCGILKRYSPHYSPQEMSYHNSGPNFLRILPK